MAKRYVSVKNQRIEIKIESDKTQHSIVIRGHDLPNGWTKMKKAEQEQFLKDHAAKYLATFTAVAKVVKIG